MRRALLAAWLCLAACRAGPQTARPSEQVTANVVAVDLQPEGKGKVSFLLELAGRADETGTVEKVTWELLLSGHDFAAGVITSGATLRAGGPTQVAIDAPIAFGAMGFDARARTLPVALRGEVLIQWPWGEESRGFSTQGRIAVRGAPAWER